MVLSLYYALEPEKLQIILMPASNPEGFLHGRSEMQPRRTDI